MVFSLDKRAIPRQNIPAHTFSRLETKAKGHGATWNLFSVCLQLDGWKQKEIPCAWPSIGYKTFQFLLAHSAERMESKPHLGIGIGDRWLSLSICLFWAHFNTRLCLRPKRDCEAGRRCSKNQREKPKPRERVPQKSDTFYELLASHRPAKNANQIGDKFIDEIV